MGLFAGWTGLVGNNDGDHFEIVAPEELCFVSGEVADEARHIALRGVGRQMHVFAVVLGKRDFFPCGRLEMLRKVAA